MWGGMWVKVLLRRFLKILVSSGPKEYKNNKLPKAEEHASAI